MKRTPQTERTPQAERTQHAEQESVISDLGAKPIAYVVLSVRLALTRRSIRVTRAAEAESAPLSRSIRRYRMLPIARVELEAMTIVRAWLRERQANDGRRFFISTARRSTRRGIISATNQDGVDSASSVTSATSSRRHYRCRQMRASRWRSVPAAAADYIAATQSGSFKDLLLSARKDISAQKTIR